MTATTYSTLPVDLDECDYMTEQSDELTRCARPADVDQVWGCGHEHSHLTPLCTEHADSFRDRSTLVCKPCFDFDGHECSVRLVSEVAR